MGRGVGGSETGWGRGGEGSESLAPCSHFGAMSFVVNVHTKRWGGAGPHPSQVPLRSRWYPNAVVLTKRQLRLALRLPRAAPIDDHVPLPPASWRPTPCAVPPPVWAVPPTSL